MTEKLKEKNSTNFEKKIKFSILKKKIKLDEIKKAKLPLASFKVENQVLSIQKEAKLLQINKQKTFKTEFQFFNKLVDKPLYKNNWQNNLYIKKIKEKPIKEKFINLLMENGEKNKAYNIFIKTGNIIREKKSLNIQDFSKLIENHRSENYLSTFSTKVKTAPFFFTKLKVDSSEYLSNKEINSILTQYTTVSLEKFLKICIENVKPTLEVRRVRIAGTTYQVPAFISKKRQESIAIRWLINSAKKRKRNTNLSFPDCLAQELLDAYNKQGHARQKRDELHSIAESNRAFIRYRWW